MVDKPKVAVLGDSVAQVLSRFYPAPLEMVAVNDSFGESGTPMQLLKKYAYFNLQKLGFKSLLTDRKGMELSSGGDYELCYAFALAGYDLLYDDRLHFKHFITKERLTWEYFMRYAKESAKCFDVLEAYKFVAILGVKNFNWMRLKNLSYSLRIYLIINFRLLFATRNSTQ